MCYAELQIPELIKENTKQMSLKGNLNEKNIMSLISLLVNQKIIQNTHGKKHGQPYDRGGWPSTRNGTLK